MDTTNDDLQLGPPPAPDASASLPDVPEVDQRQLETAARSVLDQNWRDELSATLPHGGHYGDAAWLWDSAMHVIARAALRDPKAATELAAIVSTDAPSGFVPHMRLIRPNAVHRWRDDSSSITQPPLYAFAHRRMLDLGLDPERGTIAAMERGLDALWRTRMPTMAQLDATGAPPGLLVVVHPYEPGEDDSPRWDSLVTDRWRDANLIYHHDVWTQADYQMMDSLVIDDEGFAHWNPRCTVIAAQFNAIAAHAAAELAPYSSDPQLWERRSRNLADAMDTYLWDDQGLTWRDVIIDGGPDGQNDVAFQGPRTPTLGGALGALVTSDETRARTALAQMRDPQWFRGDYGLAYVARHHPRFDARYYWRGTSWTVLDSLARDAAQRWGDDELADHIARISRRGAMASDMAEHINPLTGAAGIQPTTDDDGAPRARTSPHQSWTAATVAMIPGDNAHPRRIS